MVMECIFIKPGTDLKVKMLRFSFVNWIGQWVANLKEGNGTYHYVDGSKFIGNREFIKKM